MFKRLLILLLSIFLLFSCSKKNNKEVITSEPTEKEMAAAIYLEAVESLKAGDAFYASKKFKEVETMLPQLSLIHI